MRETVCEILTLGLIFGIPALIFLWAGISFVRYRKRDRQNEQQCRSRKAMLIISAAAAGIMAAAIIALMILLMLAAAHM